MSKKVLDQKGRFRNKLISFRMSPEESKMLDRKVALAGISKQDYIINSILNKYTDNIEKISKVAYGREWTHGFIYVYRPFDKTESLLISEGEFEKGDLADYIQKNGYNEKSIGIWYGGVSIIVIISCIIKLKFAKK